MMLGEDITKSIVSSLKTKKDTLDETEYENI